MKLYFVTGKNVFGYVEFGGHWLANNPQHAITLAIAAIANNPHHTVAVSDLTFKARRSKANPAEMAMNA